MRNQNSFKCLLRCSELVDEAFSASNPFCMCVSEGEVLRFRQWHAHSTGLSFAFSLSECIPLIISRIHHLMLIADERWILKHSRHCNYLPYFQFSKTSQSNINSLRPFLTHTPQILILFRTLKEHIQSIRESLKLSCHLCIMSSARASTTYIDIVSSDFSLCASSLDGMRAILPIQPLITHPVGHCGVSRM